MNNALPRGRARRDHRRARFAGALTLSTALMTGGALSAMAAPAPATAPAVTPMVHGVAVSGQGQLRADGLYYSFALNARATNAVTGAGATGSCTVAGGGTLAAGCTSVTSVTRGTGANANTATITGTARTAFNQRVTFRMVVTDRANPNGAGRDTIALTINGRTTQATLTRGNITITDTTPPPPANHAPVAQGDTYSTIEDNPLYEASENGLLHNDTDADGDPVTAQLVTKPVHGSVAPNADGSFTYTPDANYNGTDSFTYTATDAKGATSAPATVTLTITPVNDVPVAQNDSYSTAEDTLLTVNGNGVLANDTDADHDPLTAQVLTQPTHGTLTPNANGSFTYNPDANYNGTDSFTYATSDGNGATSAPSTVTLTITPVNDPPVAADDTYSTNQDTTLDVPASTSVLANDTDADHDPLTAEAVSKPVHGGLELNADGTFTYKPDLGYTGPDSFTYTTSDSNGATSAPATVTLTVNPAPVSNDDYYTIPVDGRLNVPAPGVLSNDNNAGGAGLTVDFNSVTRPSHSAFLDLAGGFLIGPDGGFFYTPTHGFTGTDTFTYRFTDGHTLSDPVTVHITVAPEL